MGEKLTYPKPSLANRELLMNAGILLILFMVFAGGIHGPALAQTADRSSSNRPPPGLLLTSRAAEDAVIAARTDMMAFRLDAAEDAFRALLRAPGNDEAARYHLTGIALLKVMFEQTEPYFSEFFEESDALRDLLDDVDESSWRHFFDAENYLMRAFVHGRQGDFLRTAISARESYERYLDALRADPTMLDAQVGIGLLKALIGATPPAYRRFLKMLGYSGTVEEGIRFLDHAATGARYNGELAALFRDVTRIYMNRDRKAGVAALAARYKEDPNPVTGLLYSFALRYNRNPEKAAEVAREAIAIGERPGYTQVAFLYFHLGSALFSLNRFEEATSALAIYMRTFNGQSFRSTAQVRLGLSLEMLGRRDEAEQVYRRVEAPTEFDIDVAAEREASELLDKPLSENGKRLLRGRNAVSGGRFDEALAALEPVFFGRDVSDYQRTEAAYWLGRAHHYAGNLDEAANKYFYVRTHPARKHERWAPWATYYLGRIRKARGQKDEARTLFKEALQYGGDYDYRKSLRRNARLAMDGL